MVVGDIVAFFVLSMLFVYHSVKVLFISTGKLKEKIDYLFLETQV
jgi:hypothetical protein